MQSSAWNSGAWHWEERQFTPWAQEYLSKAFSGITAESDRVGIKVIEQLAFRVEASENFRKGRRVLLLFIDVKYKWEARYKGDTPSSDVVYGLLQVPEVTLEDVSGDFTVVAHSRGSTPLDADCRPLCTGILIPTARRIVRQFLADLEEEIAKADAVEAASKAMAVVSVSAPTTASSPAASASEGSPSALDPSALVPPSAAVTDGVSGEVVPGVVFATSAAAPSTSAPMWQEKPWTKWANSSLNDAFKVFENEYPGGTVRITNVLEIRGEAFSAFRRGAKSCFFEMHIKLKWEGEMYDKDGETLGTGDGEIHILDFDQDSDLARSETLIKVIPCEDADANDHKVAAFVLKYAVKDLRKILAKFVKELNEKA